MFGARRPAAYLTSKQLPTKPVTTLSASFWLDSNNKEKSSVTITSLPATTQKEGAITASLPVTQSGDTSKSVSIVIEQPTRNIADNTSKSNGKCLCFYNFKAYTTIKLFQN